MEHGTITQDMASIISLINQVAGKSSTETRYTISFNDANNRQIGDPVVIQGDGNQTVTLGRIVELKLPAIEGEEEQQTFARFNTMKEDGGDNGNDQLVIPLKQFTFKNGNNEITLNLVSNEDKTVDLTDYSNGQDINLLMVEELE